MNDLRTPQNSRRIGLAALALIFLVLYGRYLIGLAPSGGDLVNQYLPYQELVRNAIRQGQAPLWNAMTFGGRPLMADIQVGVLYPPNWLHWLLPLPFSFALVLALHGAWMIAGCWRLGRHWELAPAAIALGAILYCASPFFTLKLSTGVVLFIYVGAWWPWLALTMARLVERPSFPRLAALTLVLALSLLAGSPQLTYYGWLMAVALGLTLPASAQTGEEAGASGRSWGKRLLWIGGAFVLALGLTAIQTAQTWHFISTSFERGAGASWDYVTDGSLEPRLLWLLVNPGFLGTGHEPGMYWGSRLDFAEGCFYAPLWVALLAVPLALAAWPRRSAPAAPDGGNNDGNGAEALDLDLNEPARRTRRRLTLLCAAALALGLTLALGRYSPLFKLFFQAAPGFNKFRVPARLMIFFFSGEALLAALARDALLGQRLRRGGTALIVAGLLAGLALIWVPLALREPLWRALGNPALQPGARVPPEVLPTMTAHALRLGALATAGLVFAGAILLALMRDRERLATPLRHKLAWALPLLALAELVFLALPFQQSTPVGRYRQEFYPRTELVELLQRENHGGRILWLDDVQYWDVDQNQPEIYPNRLLMYGLADARGYDPVNARWYGYWMNLLAGRDPQENPRGFMFVPQIARPAWLTLMGVETVVSYRDLTQVPGLVVVKQFPFPEGPLTIWRNTRYRGLAFAAPAPKEAANSLAALGLSADLARNPAAALEDVLTVSRGSLGEGFEPARKIDGRFRVTPQPAGPNRFAFQVEYPEPALLCLAQSAYDGWSVQIGQDLAPLATLCNTFLAVLVPAGKHEVTFEFRPEGLVPGQTLSLAAAVFLIYGLVRTRRSKRRG